MKKPIRILLQTTIPHAEDDWHIGRFSLLRDHLSSQKDDAGHRLFEVVVRDRESTAAGDDTVLSRLDETDFDELWLFAIDPGDGLSLGDCYGVSRFRQRGGGIMSTRDHQDLGSSLCTLGDVGRAHFFHSKQQESDPARQVSDDRDTEDISWPNYHSGSNGDYQKIIPAAPLHELLQKNGSEVIEYFPAHPHEGAVGVPAGEANARLVANGVSKVSGRSFGLIVAFDHAQDDHGNMLGRAVAESSFHHLVDYNWDTDAGCPSFLTEPPGDRIKREPEKLEDIKIYARNLALWLAG